MELVLKRPQRKENVKKYSILYVDDEPVNLRIFQHAFKRDYHVHTALNGFDALDIVNEKNIDLIITDQQMPRMSGVDLLAKVVPKHPSIVRMIMTGFSDIGAIIRAVNEFGLDKYLVKPWDRDQLKVEFDKALQKKEVNKKPHKKSTTTKSGGLNSSFLPTAKDLKKIFKDGFIIYDKKEDNPYGYWFGDVAHYALVIFYNSTHHNIPPHVMHSVINMTVTEIFYKEGIHTGKDIMAKLQEKIKDQFDIDPMGAIDITVVLVNKQSQKISHTGAKQSIVYISSDGQLKSVHGATNNGRLQQQEYEKVSAVYIASPNQEATDKAEGDNETLHLLRKSSHLPLKQQSSYIKKELEKKNMECVIGIHLV